MLQMRNFILSIPCFLLLASCTTTQEIVRPNGQKEYLVACGASTGWNICYKRANELCPGGYTTLSEKGGFNRKEMRISCP
jgi:hypothetical protein